MTRSRREFGQFIRRARVSAGVSQLYVASELGFRTEQMVSQVERGQKELPKKHLRRLAEVLKLDPKELLEKLLEINREDYRGVLDGSDVSQFDEKSR